jgi:hypothetical protein
MPITVLFASLACLLGPQEAAAPLELALLSHAELARELEGLAALHPELVQRSTLGTSRAGRPLEFLRLSGPGAEGTRPALLLVANLDGARVFSSSVALQHARALAEGYATDERVRALLDSTTVYVVPRANPDAAEARFETPRAERRASGIDVDNDRDGRTGEDEPADLDGDGRIAWLRVRDPDGEWIEDESDPRVLVEADRGKGQRGVFRLWPEGRDLDGDERVAEDPPRDGRVDRNFPAGWQQHAQDGGLFPSDDPEARALLDFVLARPEIALVLVYDAQDNLVGEVKGVGDDAPRVLRIPPEGVLESDAKLLGEIARRYREATGSTVKAEGAERGTFTRWCYEQRGLWTLAAALWDIPLEPPEPEEAPAEEPAEKNEPHKGKEKDGAPRPSDDAKRLEWIDAAGAAEAWRFMPWKPCEHPELGAVEIGGFAPFARLEPPAAEGARIAARHLEFLLDLGALLARVEIAECTREELGQGVTRVTAVIENPGFLPLLSRSGRRTETTRPAKVVLVLPEAARLLGGERQRLLSNLPGSGGRQEYQWLVHGPAQMELGVSVESAHAGSAFRKAEVQR